MSDIETQAAEATMSATLAAEGAGYTYQRADGTLERALSAEDAITRCPVLGRLAIEAPEQANMLLEVLAMGTAKMQADAKQEQHKPPVLEPQKGIDHKSQKQVDAPKPTPLIKPETPLAAPESAHIEKLVKPASIALGWQEDMAWHHAQQQTDLKTPIKAAEPESEAAPFIVATAGRRQQAATTAAAEGANTRNHAEEIAAKSDTDANSAAIPSQPVDVFARRSQLGSSMQVAQGIDREAAGHMILVPAESPTTGIDLAEAPIDNVHADLLGTDVPAPTIESDDAERMGGQSQPVTERWAEMSAWTAADIDEVTPESFDQETTEVYGRLNALTVDGIMPSAIAPAPLEPQNTTADLRPIGQTNEKPATTSPGFETFEAFVIAQPARNQPATLESIQAEHAGQPLEQVFVQLADYLSGDTRELEHSALADTLDALEAELPACYSEEGPGKTKPRITPEMTEQLLALLRSLGYENPGDALIGFVSKYGLDFLLQAIEYMHQLNSRTNRREFIASPALVATNNDDDARLRLGRVLFGLITVMLARTGA